MAPASATDSICPVKTEKSSKLAARPDKRGASCGTPALALNGFAEASAYKQSSLCTYPAAQLAKNLL